MTMREIIAEVARETGVRVEVLRRPVGTFEPRAIAHARQYAMWRMRQETTQSLPQIGRFLGGRDHTTVLYGVRRHAQRLAESMREAA